MKKVISLFLVSCLTAFLLCSCGSNGGNDGVSKTVKIGMITNLSGENGQYDAALLAGMELAVAEINEQSGEGVTIELLSKDSDSDPDETAETYNFLKKKGVQILVSGVSTDVSKDAVDCGAQDGMIMFSFSGVEGNHVIHMLPSPEEQADAASTLVSEKWINVKSGVIFNATSSYSTAVSDAFVKKVESAGGKVATVAAFDGAEEESAALSQCQANGCELLFLPVNHQDAVRILTAASALDYFPMFVGGDGVDGILSAEGFDCTLAEGLILVKGDKNTDYFTASSFVEAYRQKTGGQQPNGFAAAGYDLMFAVYRACLSSGVDGNTAAADVCTLIKSAFSQLTVDGLTGTDLHWNQQGYLSKNYCTVVIDDGKYVSLETDR